MAKVRVYELAKEFVHPEGKSGVAAVARWFQLTDPGPAAFAADQTAVLTSARNQLAVPAPPA